MAELYRFFNSVEGDVRTYQAEDMAQFFGNFLGNGFFEGLGITANNNMTVNVAAGSAMIEGHEYTNTDKKILELDAADSTRDRIDRIVLRLDRNVDNRYIKAFVKKGEVGSNTPPLLTRNDYVYELSLAQVVIEAGKSFIDSSQITDERGNHELCGRVQVARKVGDQINTVDIKTVEQRPAEYAEGIVQFYLSGESQPEIMQGWLDSIGISPSDFGRNLGSLRAYVHTVANRTNTGIQTFTLFAWDYQSDYKIYGEWKRANNAIASSVEWGIWHDTDLIIERGTTENGDYAKYSSGRMECRLTRNAGSRIALGNGTYDNPYRTTAFTWNFPESFKTPPIISGSTEIDSTNAQARMGTVVFRNTTADSSAFIQAVSFSGASSDVDVTMHLLAIGRWR